MILNEEEEDDLPDKQYLSMSAVEEGHDLSAHFKEETIDPTNLSFRINNASPFGAQSRTSTPGNLMINNQISRNI